MEIACEDVLAGQIGAHEHLRRRPEVDRIDLQLPDHMFVEWCRGGLRHDVETIDDPAGRGNEAIIGRCERGIAGARAGIRERSRLGERGVGGDVEGGERGEGAAETVAADGDRRHRHPPRERRQRRDKVRRTGIGKNRERSVHRREAVVGHAGTTAHRTGHIEESGVLEPLIDSFRAADGDHALAGRGVLEHHPDRDALLAPFGADVGGQIVGVDRRDHRILDLG